MKILTVENAGGLLTILGEDLGTAGVVTVNGLNETVQHWEPTRIVCDSPADAKTPDVRVTAHDGQMASTGAMNFQVKRARMESGGRVIITGGGFGTEGQARVRGVPLDISAWSDSLILGTCVVPIPEGATVEVQVGKAIALHSVTL